MSSVSNETTPQQLVPLLGPSPVSITCPSCKNVVYTRVEYSPGLKTHLCAGVLCVLLLWCCAWIPYTKRSCKNVTHFCSNCGFNCGIYKPSPMS